MNTKQSLIDQAVTSEFEIFWQQVNTRGGSIYKEKDREFIDGLRKNFHEVHNAELNLEERRYFSSTNGQPITMGYAFSIHDLLDIIGLDYEVYNTNRKNDYGYECKGIQMCFGNNHTINRNGGVKTINTERLELIMRPLLYEAQTKAMVELEDGTYWSTAPSMIPADIDCPPPLDHCKPVSNVE